MGRIMKTAISMILLLTALSGSGCSGNAPPPEAGVAEQDSIRQNILAYYKDMSDRSWGRYRSHFWDNATITTVWQRPGDSSRRVHVITIDEFIRDTPNGPDSKPVFEETMLGSEVAVTGNLSVVWARYEAKFGSRDSLARWQGTDVFTLLRFGGTWKIVSLVFESDG
jgi:hypothetical protein